MLQKYTSESDNTTRATVRGKVGYIKECGQNWCNVYVYPSEDAQYVRVFCKKDAIADIRTGNIVDVDGKVSVYDGREYLSEASVTPVPRRQTQAVTLPKPYAEILGEPLKEALTEKYGTRSLWMLRSEPECLLSLKGQEPDSSVQEKVDKIRALAKREEMDAVGTVLTSLGIDPEYRFSAVNTFGPKAAFLIKRNPYVLCGAIPKITFREIDEAAKLTGIKEDDYRRRRGAVDYALSSLTEKEGSTCVRKDILLRRTNDCLGRSASNAVLEGILSYAVSKDKDIGIRGEFVYKSDVLEDEVKIADSLSRLVRSFVPRRVPSGEEITLNTGIPFDEGQLSAIQTALTAPVTILTGGPGTGKTATTKGIISGFEQMGLKVACMAPTGKAAIRMEESTGHLAQTVHKALGEMTPYVHGPAFPIDADVVLVDESSMLDNRMAARLTESLRNGTRLVLIGDIDQLPSVGAGKVLKDLAKSERIPVARLTKVYRKGAGSGIIKAAQCINEGRRPDDKLLTGNLEGERDFAFIEVHDDLAAKEAVLGTVMDTIPRLYGIDQKDIQILCPKRKGLQGIDELNAAIQAASTPQGGGMSVFRVGDRVMQTRNDYEKEVFNGETGTVVSCGEETIGSDSVSCVDVDFGGRVLHYTEGSDYNDLTLAYAVSVHKSQGSEFQAAVIAIDRNSAFMLNKELIYTAITRARKLCVIVGEKEVLGKVAQTSGLSERTTGLQELVRSKLPERIEKKEGLKKKEEGCYTEEDLKRGDIDPASVRRIKGSLTVKEDMFYPNLEGVDGRVTINGGKLDAPWLVYMGSLHVCPGGEFVSPVELIRGDVRLDRSSKTELSEIDYIEGSIYIHKDAVSDFNGMPLKKMHSFNLNMRRFAQENYPKTPWMFNEWKSIDENVFIVKKGDRYNLYDRGLVSEHWFANVRSPHDGWAVVEGGDEQGSNRGLFNYMNKDGVFLLSVWAQGAGDFENGVAKVEYDGHIKQINSDGHQVQNNGANLCK